MLRKAWCSPSTLIRNSDGRGGEYHKQLRNECLRMLSGSAPTIPGWRQLSWPTPLLRNPVEKLTAGRFSFLLVAKPGDHKSLYQDVELRRGSWTATPTVHRGKVRVRVGHRSPERQSRLPALLHPVPIKTATRSAMPGHLPGAHHRSVVPLRAARARWENEALESRATTCSTNGELSEALSPRVLHEIRAGDDVRTSGRRWDEDIRLGCSATRSVKSRRLSGWTPSLDYASGRTCALAQFTALALPTAGRPTPRPPGAGGSS